MPLVETVLTAIVQKAFNYALDQGQNKVVGWAQDKLGLEPRQQAFKRALSKAYKKFEKQYPQWAADLFDASFLEHEGASVLAQFLLRDGHPDPSELALRWADSLNMRDHERRTTLVRELEPAATYFLQYMTPALKAEPELSDLNDSRAFEQLASDLKAIRRKLDAEQSTPGTRWDYLHWLIERNLYLDPRGTFQTQRQVLVKLDEVYISLRAQRDKTPGEVDRRLLEKELAQLETGMVRANLSAEEVEDQREHLLARMENRLAGAKTVPGEVIELAEAVNRHERLVILGDPGSGKSTLLRYLALKHAQALYAGRSEAGSDLGTVRFPILIRVADYAEHGLPRGQSLSSYLADYYAMHECPKFGLADLLASELVQGNCLVLPDGLDEIVNADDRRKVVERIDDFIRYHDNRPNRFVITSRIAGYRSAPLGDPFVHYTVQEMDEAQIRRFLERWCTAVEAAQAPDLSQGVRDAVARREIDAIMKAVQTSPGVRRLAANPLLLRTLALIHRTSAQLPQKRVELYKLAADTLARTWRTAQGVPESALADDRYLTRLLGRLAFWLHENKSTGIATEQEVYRELGQEWARIKGQDWEEDNPDIESEVKKFLRAVREHTGLFVERAPRRYGFMHLTFEEYYAARYLVARSKGRAQLIHQHLHKPRWEEPILLALGFVGLDSPEDAAELMETTIMAQGEEAKELDFSPSPYEDLLGQDYLFALRCLGDNIPVRPKLLKQLMERLAGELLHHTDPARFERYREALNERLSYLGASDVASVLLSRLVTALHDSDADVRYRAGQSLGQLGQVSPEAVAALVAALHDSDYSVRRYAAGSLERLGHAPPEAVAALVAALHDSDAGVRLYAAQSLGQVGQTSPEAVAALAAVLHESDDNARRSAAYSLWRVGQVSPEALAAL
ncbi:MAG: NACHT domain-containing protein, partial [Ktedonobacteraceae bacterium]